MKMTTRIMLAAYSITALINFSSCKSDEAPVTPVCHITTITSPGLDTVFLKYTSDGRIDMIRQGTFVSNFIYSSDKIIRNYRDAGVFAGSSISTLDQAGNRINVRHNQDEAGTSWINDAYEFIGNQESKMTVSNSSGQSYLVNFQWNAGDYVKSTAADDPANPINLTYYTDKTYREGDYEFYNYVCNGSNFYRSAHLRKSQMSTNYLQQYEYTFDANERITSMKISYTSNGIPGTPVIFYYTYECN